jgi:murein L,D-transpeptidase YcbB/YkuD
VVVTGGSSGKSGEYKAYLGRLAPIASGSQQVGASLGRLLAQVQQGRVSAPTSKLDPLLRRARAQLAAAQALKPPAGLRSEHEQVLSALAFRVSGLQGLRAALGQRSGAANSAGLTTTLGRQIDALVTSDVVWRSLFVQPVVAALRQLHLAASLAPQSTFVANANLSSPQSIALLAQPQAPAVAPVLRLGSTGAAVVTWQKQLNKWLRLKHLTPVTADGAFGPGTQAATQALQRSTALAPDGVVGAATRKALAKALQSKG